MELRRIPELCIHTGNQMTVKGLKTTTM